MFYTRLPENTFIFVFFYPNIEYYIDNVVLFDKALFVEKANTAPQFVLKSLFNNIL